MSLSNFFKIPETATIKDNSGFGMDRIRITFKNGYSLSVIRGDFSYGGQRGLFEVAPFTKKGEMSGSLLNFKGDDVKGYLSIEEVNSYIQQMEEKE